MKRNQVVVLETPGYSGRFGIFEMPTTPAKDGTKQHRITLRGTFMTLTFQEGEFREASQAELDYLKKNPTARSIDANPKD